jgi:hypothetical protein
MTGSSWKRILFLLLFLPLFLVISSCSAKYLKYENEDKLNRIDEFDSAVKITSADDKTVNPAPSAPKTAQQLAKEAKDAKEIARARRKRKKADKKTKESSDSSVSGKHEPDIEDGEGFVGRRPQIDPFKVGESVTHSVKYFKMHAGTLTLKVDPFVEVNGRKSYSFGAEVKTASVFDSFYSAHDTVLTQVDFDQLMPRAFTMHVKETGQLREARSFFDDDKLTATYWEKKVTEKNGAEEKKQHWDILPFSQNVFSALFYMRTFKWDLGKTYAFRVADDEQNLVFTAKAIRREVLDTELGEMKAIVIKPEITVKGVFKPVGDIFIWLSDDDRKLVLRIEAKVRIGTLVSEVVSMTPGN